jgi:hypothetical protein
VISPQPDPVIFAPSSIGHEPFAITLNTRAFPAGTKVRAALFNGDRACSRIWNGEKWISSDSPWAEMPAVSEKIFVKFYPYSNSTLGSVSSLRIRFRTDNKTTDWIEKDVEPVVGGAIEGYAERDGKPTENEEIRVYKGDELFALSISEQNPIYDFEGRGYFRISLPPGSYYLHYGDKSIPFTIRRNETTSINAEAKKLRINELFFQGAKEWIELRAFEPVSMDGWCITDRDNFNLSLNEDLKTGELYMIDLFSIYGKAVMTDTGDDLMLIDDFGRAADFLGYGSSGYVDPPPEGFSVLNSTCEDGESIALINGSYVPSKPTRGLPNDLEIRKGFSYEKAEPFLSPGDSFDRVMSLFGSARERVYISTYTFGSLPVYQSLLDLRKNGVDVRLILGQKSPIELELPSVIATKPLNHAKYAIIDDLFLIGSENFDENGLPAMGGNRGWWILLRGSDIDLHNLFALDWNNALGEPMISCLEPAGAASAKGKLLLSPENSFTELISFIDSARQEIYAEQLYITNEDIIRALKRAMDRGVGVTLIIDDRNALIIEGATILSRKGIHNKGMIVDSSTVLISSINMSDESIFENREVGVLISDGGVAKYFYANRIS